MRFMFFAKFVPLAVVLAVVFTACGSASEDAVEAPPSTVEVALPTVQPTTVEPVVEPTGVPTGVPTEVAVEPSVEAESVSPEVVSPSPAVEPVPVVVCEVLVVHGEPHEGVPVDTDGDGFDDDCFYLGGGAGHTHETPTPTAEPAETGGSINPPAQPAEPAAPVATATPAPAEPAPEPSGSRVTSRSGSGAGWYWDSDGVAVVTGVVSPPAHGVMELDVSLGEDPAYLERVAQCMTSSVLNGNTWSSSRLYTDCVSEMRWVETPLRYHGRDRLCVYDAQLQNIVGAFDGGPFYSVTLYDCPTGPDGIDPNPLRPYEVRCNELVDRLEAQGHNPAFASLGDTSGILDDADYHCADHRLLAFFQGDTLGYDPNDPNPCAYQSSAAMALYLVWLAMTGTDWPQREGLGGGVLCLSPTDVGGVYF